MPSCLPSERHTPTEQRPGPTEEQFIPPLTCRQPGQSITDKLMSTVMTIMMIMTIMVMIMTREMFRSSHYNYLIIGHLLMTPPSAARLPLCLTSECVSSDIKIVSLRPQTTDSQPHENIFSANAKKMVKYVKCLNTIDVKRF